MSEGLNNQYNFYQADPKTWLEKLGKDVLIKALEQMLLIRNFEKRAEACYQQGKIGGFFHSYIGQEAIQTSCVLAFGLNHWYTTTYRCHALALLLGATPNEVMAELFGKETGNAKGRGGSMHLYTDRMLGGFGIVGGHTPVAAGAAFASKYLKKNQELSLCFLGDGATVQGAFHEALNLCSLWDLPCMYVIENNIWGMGTHVDRAVCVQPIAEKKAEGYRMKSYTLDGMDFFNCYAAFYEICEQMKKDHRPVLVEVITERFKGHSVSDPGLYRSKEDLKKCMERDPLIVMKKYLIEAGMLTEDEYNNLDKKFRQTVIESVKFAEESPDPNPTTLEEGVLIPEEKR